MSRLRGCSCSYSDGIIDEIEDIMSDISTADVMPITEGATNGDMIKAIFPNARVSEIYPSFNGDEVYYVPIQKFNGVTNEMRVMKSWWNEPYRKAKYKKDDGVADCLENLKKNIEE